jgi:hypothetical protein
MEAPSEDKDSESESPSISEEAPLSPVIEQLWDYLASPRTDELHIDVDLADRSEVLK